ncbi:MAG TPA: hypothetical protein VM186_13885 [Planctomycetota bacterium]|nr:hypothetical protein [Planctomycetota bacterium]
MAIDRVKKAALLVPRKETHRLLNRLHALSAVHIEDAAKVLAPPDDAPLGKESLSSEKADLNIKKLDIILSTFGLFIKSKQGFVEGFAPLPLQVTSEELHKVISEFDFGPLYERCSYIYDEYRSLQSQIEQSQAEKGSLAEFAAFPFSIREALALKHVTVVYGSFRKQNWDAFTTNRDARELVAWDVVRSTKQETRAAVAFVNEDADAARELLRANGFSGIALPRLPGEVSDRIKELEEDIEERREQQEAFRGEVQKLAVDERRVKIAVGHWESERTKIEAHNSVLNSRRMSVVTGWIRTRDLQRVQRVLDAEFPEASLVLEDPAGSDNVPVSLTMKGLWRPAQILVGMFGLPDYFSFDPTPWLIFSFLLFFSFCFGDVVYGLGLVVLSWVLARKYSTHPSHRRFFRLFFYGGVGTMIFGALTGAWAGNLYSPDFLGDDNMFYRLVQMIPHVDPLDKPMLMLGAALGIGVANQFYGIILNMYKMFRKHRPLDALFDGGLWLLFLPGLMLMGLPMFAKDTPAWTGTLGKVLAGVGAAGLVLTQGRNEKGILLKAITGIVSLYGVLGTYGLTSFVGDVLSYSRLLALGFTTSIVAMAFNMIANMFTSIPMAGAVVFAAVLAFGHTFNFAVSILSAFVHSARLIFLEFFNRFYEGGARPFTPLSFNSVRVELVDGPQ